MHRRLAELRLLLDQPLRIMKPTIGGAALACLLFSLASKCQDRATSDQKNAVDVQMRNVVYHFTPSVTAHIETLNGEIVPVGNNEFPVFDDKDSFRIQIRAAEIAISTESLANDLNSYVFARPSAPLKGISIRVQSGRLIVKGKLHGRGDIPFEMEGVLSPTADGNIRLHGQKISVLHLPVKGLMDLFGIHVADLIKNGKVPGVSAQADDLILEPSLILPAPHIEGRVTAIRLADDNIVQTFSSGETQSVPKYLPIPNYMSYRGNRLRFGKLTMDHSDLVLIDMDPADPFDFYLDHYKDQLATGYAKITRDFGLRVYMKDFNKLRRPEDSR